MIKMAVDLHIHTALSPCADDDMTPNNIVNMSLIKGLDAIGITDHNSIDNVEAVMKVASGRLLVVPGIELQTNEEIHLLAYFKSLDALISFNDFLKDRAPFGKNVPSIFGNQLVIDEDDRMISNKEDLLLASMNISLDEAIWEIKKRDGAAVPAHINRGSFSLISQLGFVPENLEGYLLEVTSSYPEDNPLFNGRRLIRSSDAHNLASILEADNFLKVPEMSLSGLVESLKERQ